MDRLGVSAADLLDHLAARLVRYKVPRAIRFVEALPKTTVRPPRALRCSARGGWASSA